MPESGLFALGFLKLPIDPELHPPDGKQVELGFGLPRDDLVANAELPFPDARRDRRHGVFDALVIHYKNPAAALAASNPDLILKIARVNQCN